MSEFLAELIEAATATDGQPPFSDQSLVDLSAGTRRLLTVPAESSPAGAALVSIGDGSAQASSEAELVVHPDARRRGLGERLLLDVMDTTAGSRLLIWAHGDHPGARALAAKHGFAPVRELLQLRARLGSTAERPAPDVGDRAVRPFRSGVDDTAWLDLNARAFAGHPEQGKLTRRDLDARKAEHWFDPADFLLLWEGDQPIGFCWLKVEHGLGEFYAVGVDPARQGQRIGRTLVEAGLARLADCGIREATLYVEADNEPAVRLYRSYGFTNHTVDIQYRRESTPNPFTSA